MISKQIQQSIKQTESDRIEPILERIEWAQKMLGELLQYADSTGGLNHERYERLMSMQYHLTKGVQRHFLIIAAHPRFSNRKTFRQFLFRFAEEEEPHYEIAGRDIHAIKGRLSEIPFSVELWWLYFDSVVEQKPFVRLGATCVLENMIGKNEVFLDKIIKKSQFLNPSNTRFITIHKHGIELPHGDQILDALRSIDLSDKEIEELCLGAERAIELYRMMLNWVFQKKD